MEEFIAESTSRLKLRKLANKIKDKFNLQGNLYLDVLRLLELICVVIPDTNYEIVPDDTFPPHIHGDTDIIKKEIRIKESVYDGAVNRNGRDRMTVAHEIAHLLLLGGMFDIKLQRNFKKDEVLPYRSPEWQAKCFAAELLIPADLTKDMTPKEIAQKCGVSKAAANYQYNVNRNLKKKGIL